MSWHATSKKRRHALRLGYDSGFEVIVAKDLKERGIKFIYHDPESEIEYTIPESQHKYTPDFVLPNGIIIETKGRFTLEDRKKHLLIKKQNPKLDIRFIFGNPNKRLKKKAKSTYADWCEKHGFLFAKKEIPEEWIEERKKRKKKKVK